MIPEKDRPGGAGDRSANELSGDVTGDGAEEVFPGDEPVRVPIETVLDLHSFLPAEVESVVREYLEEAYRAGFEEVRIIHGRGIGVQREIVRSVLSRTPYIVSFRDAGPLGGGWGATVALLRQP